MQQLIKSYNGAQPFFPCPVIFKNRNNIITAIKF